METFYKDNSSSYEEGIAKILSQVSYFIHPNVIQRVVEKNIEFRKILNEINQEISETFLYDGSDCIFPGVRRVVDAEKKGKWKNALNDADKTILNDNTYPRHLWVSLLTGKNYSGGNTGTWNKYNFNAFEVAHIFGHKTDEMNIEKKVFNSFDDQKKPYALFTSASNTILIPNGLTKPTDKSQIIKLIFFKRHSELYGNIVKLPGMNYLKDELIPDWYRNIEWPEQKLNLNWETNLEKLFDFRDKHIISKYKNLNL